MTGEYTVEEMRRRATPSARRATERKAADLAGASEEGDALREEGDR